MRTTRWTNAVLLAAAFTLVACGIPDEPSVARQAMSASTPPLTITAQLNETSVLEAEGMALQVAGVDNGDWNADQRPDSRVNGFHEVTLTRPQPSITRTFSANALEDSVDFILIVSLTETSEEVVRLRLAYQEPHGWYVALPGRDWTPFGTAPLSAPGEVLIRSIDIPAELIISDPRLP